MDSINPQYFENSRKLVMTLGKKPEEVDGFIRLKNEKKRKYGDVWLG